MVRLSISNQKQGRKGLLLCVMYEIYKRGNLFSLIKFVRFPLLGNLPLIS